MADDVAGAVRAREAKPVRRADQARNRERIVAAAREVFAVRGTGAPMDLITRTAGVGSATLYRHFPDRDTLVHGVCLDVADRISERGRAALAEEADPFEALRRFAVGAVEEGIGALCLMLPDHLWVDDVELHAARRRVDAVAEEVVRRAQRAGRMRGDVGVGDVMVALSQLARPLPEGVCADIERLTERHVRLFLAGLELPGGGGLPDGGPGWPSAELPGRPATLEDLRR
ncbi:TetR/AcrR family transcriptional regulator [Streptomyces sp. SudanB182_2057]|uniref:TetR/AcrR family transcriptional regulator n=1 Tax=Streptomyces sp. SudanB182_2057 TaxID=3035281 RepID=UPI003F5615BC